MSWATNLIFESRPAEFRSSFSIDESVRRLSLATGRSVFSALTQQRAVGKVSAARVSLQRVIPFFGNSFKPFFKGTFENMSGCVVLVGRFTMPTITKVFMSIWFGFCSLWTVSATVAVFGEGRSEIWWFPFAGLGMIALGALFVMLAKRLSRNDIAWLSAVIQEALSETESGAQPRAQ